MTNIVIDDRSDGDSAPDRGSQQGSKVAPAGSNTWAPGTVNRMGLVVAGLIHITLDF